MKSERTLNTTKWHELFRQQAAPLASHVRNLAFVREALAAIHIARPELSPPMNRLFELHAHLYLLGLLLNRSPDQTGHGGAFIGFHTHEAIADTQKRIAALLHEQTVVKDETSYWLIIGETVDYLRKQMLTETGTKLYFAEPYFWLWHHSISPYQTDNHLYLDELRKLQAAKTELGQALSRYSWMTAQAWMHFFLRQDTEAHAALIELNNRIHLQPTDVFLLLQALENTGEWERLAVWLNKLTPLMEKERQLTLNSFYRYWDAVIEHLPALQEQMWEPIIRSLPYTESIYEEKLLRYEKWQQWMDYQLSTGTEPLSYRVSVLAPIEKHAPELLLPFYHQAAERYVLLRNRDGYKTAVKLLKRLAKLYKKMKDEERWEAYIDAFSTRHSRLRALQEELRKGKLIT